MGYWSTILFWTALGFLLGSIPFSLLAGWLFLGKDIRSLGDSNPGAVNAWKAGGWKVGLPVLLLDFGKGFAPVFMTSYFGWVTGWALVPLALAPVLGHAFSPFLRGQGGKAIAVTFGIWSGLTLWVGPVTLALGLTLFLIFFRGDAWAILAGMVALLAVLLPLGSNPAFFLVWLGNLAILVVRHIPQLRQPPRLKLLPGSRRSPR